MGKNYVICTLGYSWDRIIARKMPKSMHNMWPYIGKELCLLPQEDIPVDYGYEFTLPLESPEGYPVITLYI